MENKEDPTSSDVTAIASFLEYIDTIKHLVAKNISSLEEQLSEKEYRSLLETIKKYQPQIPAKQNKQPSLHVIKHVAEAIDLSFFEISQGDAIAQLERGIKGVDATMSMLAPVGLLVSSGVTLLALPVQCLRERRPPTQDEGIKAGLAVATIVLASIAIAYPPIAIGFLIAAASVSLVTSMQNIRLAKQLLPQKLERVSSLNDKMDTLNEEIKALESSEEDEEHIQRFTQKINELTKTTVDLLKLGHEIHALKNELNNPVHKASQATSLLIGAVMIAGLVCTIFFPPVGVGLLAGVGLAALSIMAIEKGAKWYNNRQIKSMKPSPEQLVEGAVEDSTFHMNEELMDEATLSPVHLNQQSPVSTKPNQPYHDESQKTEVKEDITPSASPKPMAREDSDVIKDLEKAFKEEMRSPGLVMSSKADDKEILDNERKEEAIKSAYQDIKEEEQQLEQTTPPAEPKPYDEGH